MKNDWGLFFVLFFLSFCVVERLRRGLVGLLLILAQGLPLGAEQLGQLHHLQVRIGGLHLCTLGVAEEHVGAQGLLGSVGILLLLDAAGLATGGSRRGTSGSDSGKALAQVSELLGQEIHGGLQLGKLGGLGSGTGDGGLGRHLGGRSYLLKRNECRQKGVRIGKKEQTPFNFVHQTPLKSGKMSLYLCIP